MKVAINRCWGGFSISEKAVFRYAELKGITIVARKTDSDYFTHYYIDGIEDDEHYFTPHFSFWDNDERTDPYLIQTIEELGEEANGACAELMVVDVPDDVKWYISENDGVEYVHELHRMWP